MKGSLGVGRGQIWGVARGERMDVLHWGSNQARHHWRGGEKIYKSYMILVKQVQHIQQAVVFHRGGQSKLWRG